MTATQNTAHVLVTQETLPDLPSSMLITKSAEPCITESIGTVLVTGADGFMGSHLTEGLCHLGAHVHAFVRATSSGALNNIGHLRGAVTPARRRLLAHGSTRCVTVDAPTAPPGSGFPAPVEYDSRRGKTPRWSGPSASLTRTGANSLDALEGADAVVHLAGLPDEAPLPDLLAAVGLGPPHRPGPDDDELFAAIDRRHTHRAVRLDAIPVRIQLHRLARHRFDDLRKSARPNGMSTRFQAA